MDEARFAGRVQGGRLPSTVNTGIARALRALDGKVVECVIREQKDTRSQQANRYYWGVVLKYIAEDTGHHAEELHEFFKDEFLAPKVIRLEDDAGGAIERKIHPSTTKLTTKEFAEYIERVREFALHRLNIVIPTAEECAA